MDAEIYLRALIGVTRYGLGKAVDAVLAGALGHTFFPAPPELRIQCDKAMEPHEAERERIAHRQRMADEANQFPDHEEPTANAKARVSKAYAEYCARHEAGKRTEPVAMRHYDPELLATIPDNPKFKERQGVRGGPS